MVLSDRVGANWRIRNSTFLLHPHHRVQTDVAFRPNHSYAGLPYRSLGSLPRRVWNQRKGIIGNTHSVACCSSSESELII